MGCPAGRLFVPDSVHTTVLRWGHSSKLMCHPGVRRSLEPSVHGYVQDKDWANQSPVGLTLTLPISSHSLVACCPGICFWSPSFQCNTAILTMVDHLSKAVRFISLPKILSDHIFWIHGLPEGAQFVSHFWRDFCRQLGFHPQTDGQTERANQDLIRMIRCQLPITPPPNLGSICP